MIVFQAVQTCYGRLFVIYRQFFLKLDVREVCGIFQTVLQIVALHQIIEIESVLFEWCQWQLLPEGTNRAVRHRDTADESQQNDSE